MKIIEHRGKMVNFPLKSDEFCVKSTTLLTGVEIIKVEANLSS